jgi:hypothetical protein
LPIDVVVSDGSSGFQDTVIVAHDQGWDIAADILNNASIAQAVGVIGVHVRCARE